MRSTYLKHTDFKRREYVPFSLKRDQRPPERLFKAGRWLGFHMHAYSFPFIYFRCNLQSDKCSASRARMHLQPRPTVRTADRRAPSTPADAGRSPLAPKRHGRASTASSPVGDSPVGARRASIPPMPRHGPPGNRAARTRRRRADSRQAATAATHAHGRGAAADGVWMIARPAPAGRPVRQLSPPRQ